MKKHSEKRDAREYFIKTICFLAVFLVITVAAVFAAIKPVTAYVHEIESRYAMADRDIVLREDTYKPLSLESDSELSVSYGDKIANISSDDFALNCSVFYGSNRVSMRSGVGLSGETELFGRGGTSLLCGYAEGALSSLEYAKVGDIVSVVTNYGEYNYKVNNISYIANEKEAYKNLPDNSLVLCGITSDFSKHSGTSLYVFLQQLDGEVN